MATKRLKFAVYVESRKVEEAVWFYKKAFGAERVASSRLYKKVGLPRLIYVEIEIGGVSFMITDVHFHEHNSDDDVYRVKRLVPGAAEFCLGTPDVKALVDKAVKAGAVTFNQDFCKDEEVKLKVPYAIVWVIKKSPKVEA